MSICGDLRGRLFAGTEEYGIWMYDVAQPAGKEWTQFTTKNGLGDDNGYALTCDRLGRVWCGHLNHGVSVFDGVKWKNYDVLTGPIGSHVIALAVNPTNGDVWGATEAGLFRYREKQRDWLYTTRADGLPSDQVSCLAFTKSGTLYAGTACNGLAIADANPEHPKWGTVRGMDTLPLTASGAGLPSNLINCLLVTSDQTLYVGTKSGLACSRDGAKTFQFIRGKDYKVKIQGLKSHPKVPANAPEGVLAEDYVTCLAAPRAGMVAVGHRKSKSEMLEWAASRTVPLKTEMDISTSMIMAGASGLTATYGSGVLTWNADGIADGSRRVAQIPALRVLPLPSAAPAPDQHRMEEIIGGMSSHGFEPWSPGECYYLGEDWATRGDWVGTYGSREAILCAAQAPLDHDIHSDLTYHVSGALGPNHNAGDGLRHWIQWLRTDDSRVLYNPMLGYRREAEWDDHAEDYAMEYNGPDIWVIVTVPAGIHKMSLYFMNKDGHFWDNRYRDYTVDVQAYPALGGNADTTPLVATARVRDFWSGVYKEFLVAGPARFRVKVEKAYSFNTLLTAVMLDKLSGPPTPFERRRALWLGPPDEPTKVTQTKVAPSPARQIRQRLDDQYTNSASIAEQRRARVLAYRAASAADAGNRDANTELTLRQWRRDIGFRTSEDSGEFNREMVTNWDFLSNELQKRVAAGASAASGVKKAH